MLTSSLTCKKIELIYNVTGGLVIDLYMFSLLGYCAVFSQVIEVEKLIYG